MVSWLSKRQSIDPSQVPMGSIADFFRWRARSLQTFQIPVGFKSIIRTISNESSSYVPTEYYSNGILQASMCTQRCHFRIRFRRTPSDAFPWVAEGSRLCRHNTPRWQWFDCVDLLGNCWRVDEWWMKRMMRSNNSGRLFQYLISVPLEAKTHVIVIFLPKFRPSPVSQTLQTLSHFSYQQ